MNKAKGALIACHECDLLQRAPSLPEGRVARCRRCGITLLRRDSQGSKRALAFCLGALILFVIANLWPIVSLKINGDFVQTTLLGAAEIMQRDDMAVVAGLVVVTTFLAPLLYMLAMIYLLLPACLGRRPPGAQLAFRGMIMIQPWGMVEVFVLGTLVSLVKLAHIAEVIPGVALWSFGCVMFLMAAAVSAFDSRDLWERLEALT